ncbi:DUF2059 domain-containing protein [Shewanella schlegeliana]|uniref:DUF2059 domain-containing protein n=1 Tax=Shewanella schlegeliana TaxID=190308 RepID=A0ABS1SXR4_9GAMM|nr:DUF2059 domain-containing protein [Shewanella schlegeliana]MBL4913319.1 DUF2059 domain-containing protein [Shewanella schlegeliana]MCL1109274.1 DUF2059 domain-containing protein [Shewanella schlegeliana]GIU24675.1 hypothetical protein TUM4433_08610 [Shewanella schlegeliana]
MKLATLPLLALITFSTSFSATTFAEPASAESVKQLMHKTGAGELGIQAMNQMLPALKNLIPDAPETFWSDYMAAFNPDDLVEMTVPIYQKYLSEEEVQALNSFYDTPAGKKLIKVQPLIMQESMMAGQQWGQAVAQDVISKYQMQKH